MPPVVLLQVWCESVGHAMPAALRRGSVYLAKLTVARGTMLPTQVLKPDEVEVMRQQRDREREEWARQK